MSVVHVDVRKDEMQKSAGARLHALHLLLVACGAQRSGNDSVVVIRWKIFSGFPAEYMF